MIKELPSEERPREKMSRYGSAALSNTELTALLLRTGTKEKSAIELAQELFRIGGFPFLAESSIEELSSVRGIGTAKACQIKAALELGKRMTRCTAFEQPSVSSSSDVATMFMEEMRYLKKEVFRVLLLNSKGRIISTETVSVGNINSAFANPREVFSPALKRGAAAVIAVHNHPGGDPQPSMDDKVTTARLFEAGKLLGVQFLDHIIIGDGRYISFREEQLLDIFGGE
ncbi:MAG: DNA repair protein RadC [Clostridia bacterium]|nr:DNA repair protein RadC [Clostridia bacterium]